MKKLMLCFLFVVTGVTTITTNAHALIYFSPIGCRSNFVQVASGCYNWSYCSDAYTGENIGYEIVQVGCGELA